MSKNNVSITKVQKMMYKMHIDDEICALSQPTMSETIENQSLNHVRQVQKPQDRSRFFYHLRQKRKQRRLEHGPVPVHHHHHQQYQQHHIKEIKRSAQEHKREILGRHINELLKHGNKSITAIVGSSIARNISIKNIESETDEIRLHFKSGSDCADALSWLKSNEGQIFMDNVNQLIFILGTNDIHRVGAFQTVQRIDYTIEQVRYLYPGVNIVWQLLQQRTRKTWLLPEGQEVLNEIEKCNVLLLELAFKKKFDTIQPGIPIQYMYDGLHPSTYGVKMMEERIRTHLKQNKMVYSSSFFNISHHFQSTSYLPPLMSINL
jgi:lysophospholipase L1-like esterase